MRELRCGRLDHHDPHNWTAPARILWGVIQSAKTYHCVGHVVTSVAEQAWAEREDRAEALAYVERAFLRERGWSW